MKVTFIFPDWVDVEATVEHDKKGHGIGHYSCAIGILSAVLKQQGHTTNLIHVCYEPKEDEFKNLLNSYADTDIFAFSFTEVEQRWVFNMNRWIKEKLNAFTISGGIYPSLYPEEVLITGGLDSVCIGEGEYALADLCNAMEKGKSYFDIKNLWFYKNGDIIKNEYGQIVEDLDTLPRYDYDIFDHHRLKIFASNLPRLFYLCIRNCNFRCSFCSNHTKRKTLKCGNKYVRRFSPDRIVSDLQYYINRFPHIKVIHFADEVIHFDKIWFRELMIKYKEKIGLPWRAYAMLRVLDEETIKLMAWSGCTRVNCGIEAGSERIRKIYKRPPISNDEIITKISLLKHYGIDVHTSTLLNAPTETIDEMLLTVKLAAKANTDIAVTGIVVPYKGTDLFEFTAEQGLLNSGVKYENTGVSIKPTGYSEEKILFLYNAYRLMIETYKFLYHQNKVTQKVFLPFVDFIVKFKYLPHRSLIKIRKRYFEGKILNWAYTKVETKLGRKEKNIKEALEC